MILYTIQDASVYEKLKKNGVFIADEKMVFWDEFVKAYKWMGKHLEKKSPKPSGVSVPLWAWYRFDGKEKKPDLRLSCHGTKGKQYVCMTIDIPDEDVLLSDQDDWHAVLNNQFLDTSTNEKEWEAQNNWFNSLPKESQEIKKIASWEYIFNIEPFSNDWRDRGRFVQAVFWELKLDQVKKVQYFSAR